MYVYIPCTLKAVHVLSRDAYEYLFHWLQQFVLKYTSLRTNLKTE